VTSLFNVFDEANYLLMVISFEGETNLKEYLELNPLLPVENASKNNFKIKKKRLSHTTLHVPCVGATRSEWCIETSSWKTS